MYFFPPSELDIVASGSSRAFTISYGYASEIYVLIQLQVLLRVTYVYALYVC